MSSTLYGGTYYSIDEKEPLASGASHGPGDFTYIVYDLLKFRLNSNSSNQTLTITALKNCHVKGIVSAGGDGIPDKSIDTDLTSGNSLYYQGQYSSAYGYYFVNFNLVIY